MLQAALQLTVGAAVLAAAFGSTRTTLILAAAAGIIGSYMG